MRKVNNAQLVTIVIVTRNAASSLERALQSVFSQPYNYVEVIVVDGGSTDESLDIIRRYTSRIKACLSEPDAGIYDAMNKGIKMANGDWVYFLGADDMLVNCLDKVAPCLRNRKTIYYGDVYLPAKNKTYAGEFKWHTLVSKNINHQAIFYPRQVFERYSFNLKYPVLADYELNLKCWGEGHLKFKYIPILIAIHNERGMSHHKIDEAFEKDKPALVACYFKRRMALRSTWLKVKRLVKNICEFGRVLISV